MYLPASFSVERRDRDGSFLLVGSEDSQVELVDRAKRFPKIHIEPVLEQ